MTCSSTKQAMASQPRDKRRISFVRKLMPSVDNQKPTARQCPSAEPRVSILLADVPESVFGKWFAGSTGDPPVPSGDSPDGTGATVRANRHGVFATLPAAVPVGGSPTGAGGSPAPPIFKTGSKSEVSQHRVRCFASNCKP